jgi:hypothetical protein
LSAWWCHDTNDHASQLSKALRLLWSGKWAVFTPASLVFAVWRFMPFFRCYQQQDAQELLSNMMDILHEELRRGGIPAAAGTLIITLSLVARSFPP